MVIVLNLLFFAFVTVIDEIPETATPDALKFTEPVTGVKDIEDAVEYGAIETSVQPGAIVHDTDVFEQMLACSSYDVALKIATL